MAEYERKKRGEVKKRKGAVQTDFNDEEDLRRERKHQRTVEDARAEALEIRKAAEKLEHSQRHSTICQE